MAIQKVLRVLAMHKAKSLTVASETFEGVFFVNRSSKDRTLPNKMYKKGQLLSHA